MTQQNDNGGTKSCNGHQSYKSEKSSVLSLYHTDDFQVQILIGKGFYSDVYKVTTEDGYPLALKLNLDIQNKFNCLREIQILRQLNHRNVLAFKGVCVSQGALHPLTEFMNGGSLAEFIASEAAIDWNSKWFIAKEIAAAMEYLHKQGFFHRDLASKNVFLEKDEMKGIQRAVVGDFGLAIQIPSKQDAVKLPVVGSAFWMAPECLSRRENEPYDHKIDVFSFGIVLCELCAQVDADPDFLPRTNDFGIDWNLFLPMLNKFNCPSSFVNILEKCTEVNPNIRPEFTEIRSFLDDNDSSSKSTARQIITGAGNILTPDSLEDSTRSSNVFEAPGNSGDHFDFLEIRKQNPFRSNSISLPFKSGGLKIWDRPSEQEIFAAMDSELCLAVKSAGIELDWHGLNEGKRNKSPQKLTRTVSDLSSVHSQGHQTLPVKRKGLKRDDIVQSQLSFAQKPSLNKSQVVVTQLAQTSHTPPIEENQKVSNGNGAQVTNMNGFLTVRNSNIVTRKEFISPGISKIRKKTRSLQNLTRDRTIISEERYSPRLKSWATVDTALNNSLLECTPIYTRGEEEENDSSELLRASHHEDSKKQSEHDIEQSENVSLENINVSLDNVSSSEKSHPDIQLKQNLCEQVDEMFNFLSYESESDLTSLPHSPERGLVGSSGSVDQQPSAESSQTEKGVQSDSSKAKEKEAMDTNYSDELRVFTYPSSDRFHPRLDDEERKNSNLETVVMSQPEKRVEPYPLSNQTEDLSKQNILRVKRKKTNGADICPCNCRVC